jgi:excisionase family DNA binding protein
MHLYERLRLPSDASAVTLTRADLMALLEDSDAEPRPVNVLADLRVQEVAHSIGRSPSTVRGWLGDGSLRGYKLNRREWRVPRSALRDYLDQQRTG